MAWTELVGSSVLEKRLQKFCEQWSGNQTPDGFQVAGTPSWFREITRASKGKKREAWLGYPYYPDVYWYSDSTTYVLELKSSAKWQPIALPEVLHHVEMLQYPPQGQPMEGPLVPVIITSVRSARASNWLRASLRHLERNGFNRDRLLFYEFASVQWGEQALFWFDDPFAEWDDEQPDFPVPEEYAGLYWYRLRGNSSWIVSSLEAHAPPLYWTQPYCLVESLGDNAGLLMWFRLPPTQPKEPWRERFYRWAPGVGAAGHPGIIL